MAKLVLIEDDPIMIRMYEKAFSFEGHKVETANNGADGIKKIKQMKPDLVLLDIMMPKMNGLEVLDKLKGTDDTKDVPVVVLTNLASEKDAEAALSKGAVRYIIKSEQDPKEVNDIVTEILAGYTRNDIPTNKGE
ncbi:response regulator [bacterium]|nr:response regulator [bacterium]